MRNERGYATMTKIPVTTRVGVRRIVIEVNRDLTIEQLGMLDDTLQRLGLIKATRLPSTISSCTKLARNELLSPRGRLWKTASKTFRLRSRALRTVDHRWVLEFFVEFHGKLLNSHRIESTTHS